MKNRFEELKLDCLKMRPGHGIGFGKGEDDQRLLKSMEELGLLNPIVVTEESDGVFRIIDGYRRYLAAGNLGLETVLCSITRELTDGEIELLRYDLNKTKA